MRIVRSLAPPVFASTRAGHRRLLRGFTLIEITIALLILGILAGMSFFSYRKMVHKARMTQAKTALKHLHKTETIYYGEHDRYTDNVALLDFDPVKYDYYLISVALDNLATSFTGTATGTGIMAGDRWFVTRDGEPNQDNASPFK